MHLALRAYVIVGAGIAGLTAAQTIRAADPRAQLTLVSDELHLPYSRPGLAYYLTNDIPERSCSRGRRLSCAA